MSGLETLPPDQRAVLQLILVQGRGYADLASTLRLDAAAVRERAQLAAAGLGLPGTDQLDAGARGRIVDYLLGQQDDGERIVTFAELGESPAACRWAQALRERLAGVAREQLPEVPAAAVAVAVGNGSLAVAPPPAPSAPPAAVAVATPPVATPPAAPAPPAPPRPPAGETGRADGPRPSRLGGAILIAGAAALAIVLAIVLIGGGGDDKSGTGTSAATNAATAPARTQAQSTTPTTASRAPAARFVGSATLRPTPAGGSAFGAGLVQRTADGRRAIAIEATRLPANGAQDIYAVWLQGTAGSKFLGFVPRQVRANGTFTVTALLPGNASSYQTVLVTREGTSQVPTTPGATILSGALRLTG